MYAQTLDLRRVEYMVARHRVNGGAAAFNEGYA
jgi:hypothetical protein